MSEVVVNELEAIDIQHHQRQRTMMAGGSSQLAIQKFEQVALVVNAGERVDDGEAIDLFVVFRLDVAAGEVTKNPVPHAEIVAVLELVHRGRLVVDEGAV